MPSFDVISKINYQEFDNALANCLREISNRYDFKGLNISIERKDKTVTTLATDELKLKQVNELLETHLVRRKVDPRVLSIKNSEGASGGTIRQVSDLKEGISQEDAKKAGEFGLMSILMLQNKMTQIVTNQRKKEFVTLLSKPIEGFKVVVVGTGSLGGALIKHISKLGAEVIGVNRRDDLQEAIAAIKAIDIGQPIDFVNFRD